MTKASIHFSQPNTLECQGSWTKATANSLLKHLAAINPPSNQEITIQANNIINLDTVGACLFLKLKQRLEALHDQINISGLNPEHTALIALIEKQGINLDSLSQPTTPTHNLFYLIGEVVVEKLQQALEFIAFIGEIATHLFFALAKPLKMQWKSLLNIIDSAGFRALPIVGLLTFLIGIVLAYQLGQQLKMYGANIYIVSLSGVAVLQEFAPLITAIIVAGRTSSAFTAQIGTMKINQEIDALRTMGLSPIDWLVLPKILGLIIALPLLTVWADCFGVLGSMVMAKIMLGVGYYDYLSRFPRVIDVSTFINGIIKAPFFAALIASVGCFQGLKVAYTADSVGKQTTKSVVQAIFLIIIADAIFSMVMSWQVLQ